MLEDLDVLSLGYTKLIEKIEDGTICIPEFQRKFVWTKPQILNLLDSIYRKYPIGSFIFWTTDRDFKAFHRIGDVEIQTLPHDQYYFVIDGQQRITTLFAAAKEAKIPIKVGSVNKNKKLEILFDLDECRFIFKDEHQRRQRQRIIAWIPAIKHGSTISDALLAIDQGSDNEFCEKYKISGSAWAHVEHSLGIFGLTRKDRNKYLLTEFGKKVLESGNLDLVANELKTKVLYIKETLKLLFDKPGARIVDISSGFQSIDGEWSEGSAYDQLARRLRWLLALGLTKREGEKNYLSDKGKRFLTSLEMEEEDHKLKCIPLPKILNVDLKYFNKLTSDQQKIFENVRKVFQEYKFSIINIANKNLEEVCDIFERINTGGTKLSIVDLMVAKTWSKNFDLRDYLFEFKKSLKAFSDLPDITILQSLAVNISGECRRKDILSLDTEDIIDNWEATLEAIRKAVDFLKSNFNLHTIKILPFPALLVPLNKFYFQKGNKEPSDRQKKILIKWMWKACLSNRFDSTVEAKLADDCRLIKELSDGKPIEFKYSYIPKTPQDLIEQKYSLGNAFVKTVLLLYMNQHPQNIVNNSPVQPDNFSKYSAREMHHVFPVNYLKKSSQGDDYIDSVVNIMFLPANIHRRQDFKKSPSHYLEIINNPGLEESLKTHLINRLEDSGLLEDDYNKFLAYRAEQILRQFEVVSGLKGIISNERMLSPEMPFSNVTYILDIIQNCSGYIYWIDPYFTRKGMAYLIEAMDVDSIKEIKILTGTKQTNKRFRDSFKKFKKEVENNNIFCEMRVITGKEIGTIHDRWLLDSNNSFNIPSINTIGRGQYAEITPTKNRPPFDKLWELGKDIMAQWNEIESELG